MLRKNYKKNIELRNFIFNLFKLEEDELISTEVKSKRREKL